MHRRALAVVVWLVGIIASTLVAANAVHTVSAPPDEESLSQHKPAAAPPAVGTGSASRTYPMTGGTVAVRCHGEVITLEYAAPEAGFAVTAAPTGPATVSARFSGPGVEEGFMGQCHGGVPEGRVEKRRHR